VGVPSGYRKDLPCRIGLTLFKVNADGTYAWRTVFVRYVAAPLLTALVAVLGAELAGVVTNPAWIEGGGVLDEILERLAGTTLLDRFASEIIALAQAYPLADVSTWMLVGVLPACCLLCLAAHYVVTISDMTRSAANPETVQAVHAICLIPPAALEGFVDRVVPSIGSGPLMYAPEIGLKDQPARKQVRILNQAYRRAPLVHVAKAVIYPGLLVIGFGGLVPIFSDGVTGLRDQSWTHHLLLLCLLPPLVDAMGATRRRIARIGL
jgi:hypothetical protein